LKDKETQFNKTLSNTQAALDRAKDKIGELEEVNFEIEDGRIVSVNQRVGVVWINVGSADGLRPKMTFKVFSVDENDAHLSESKGSIEVTRILRDHWAEARITHDDSLDPILPQDKIYSPLWAPGRHEHVALAGLIDIDGDGQSDLEQMKQIIAVNGGVIDAEMLEDGTTKGEITLNTRFLISGEEKEITATGDRLTDPSNEKKTTASGELEARARRLGVTSIPVDKFLDHIGWRPAERTVGLGEHASGVQFPPRPPVKADPSSSRTITTPSFKRRSPPINGNGSLEQRG